MMMEIIDDPNDTNDNSYDNYDGVDYDNDDLIEPNLDPIYPVHKLRYRDSLLNENNTRYDSIIAAGTDNERYIQWIVFASIALIVSTFVLTLFISIVITPNVRRRSFNLFLIFLIIPDLVFSFLCGINCVLNAKHGDYISEFWCNFQVIYCVWGIGSNAWLNAVIAKHLHAMLRCCNRRQRYFPPTTKRVVMESLSVYLYMGFLASWPFIPFLPHRPRLTVGLACLPQAYDKTSEIFFWIIFLPCFALIPTGYALYVAFDVYYNELLPPMDSGSVAKRRQRQLALYFSRLIVVFLIMWVPSIFLMFLASGHTSSWVAFAGGSWSHLQGIVSACASLMKKDVRDGFLQMFGITPKITGSSGNRTNRRRPSSDSVTVGGGRRSSIISFGFASGSDMEITGRSENMEDSSGHIALSVGEEMGSDAETLTTPQQQLTPQDRIEQHGLRFVGDDNDDSSTEASASLDHSFRPLETVDIVALKP